MWMWQSAAKGGARCIGHNSPEGEGSGAPAGRPLSVPAPAASTATALSSARRFIFMGSSRARSWRRGPGAQPARVGARVQLWTLPARLMKMASRPCAKEAAMAPQPSVQHRMVEANRIRLHVAQMGEGPAVLLCHGWPATWYSCRHPLAALAAAGFRALAPDIRGYGRHDRPAPTAAPTQLHIR